MKLKPIHKITILISFFINVFDLLHYFPSFIAVFIQILSIFGAIYLIYLICLIPLNLSKFIANKLNSLTFNDCLNSIKSISNRIKTLFLKSKTE